MRPCDDHKGLTGKYLVFKSDTGERIENCFVLRPDKDAAAVEALKAYAAATDNRILAEDLCQWVGIDVKSLKKKNQKTDLSGKCGSCKFAEDAHGVFGNSKCYIRCIHPEHKRRYYNRPISQYKQRTVRACKKYERRNERG